MELIGHINADVMLSALMGMFAAIVYDYISDEGIQDR